jgi:hypothetical protein
LETKQTIPQEGSQSRTKDFGVRMKSLNVNAANLKTCAEIVAIATVNTGMTAIGETDLRTDAMMIGAMTIEATTTARTPIGATKESLKNRDISFILSVFSVPSVPSVVFQIFKSTTEVTEITE